MKPRSWDDWRRIVRRAEARWHRRYARYGGWTHPLVLDAMYFAKALHIAWRERYYA